MIGIVSHPDDVHARAVGEHLDRLGAGHLLLDTGTLPAESTLTTWQRPGEVGGWSAEWAGRDLADVGAVWWRRPQPFRVAPEVGAPQDRGFVVGECAAAVAGLWACLDAVWVNDPDRDAAASRKMWQLQLAAGLGLRVPRTCMTNDPDRAREFIAAEPGAVVYKPFSATPQTWRETRPVREADLEGLGAVRFAPVIFQEAIPGGTDLRVTVVGEEVFPARITASGYEYDFRIDPAAPVVPCTLPEPVRRRLLALMHRLGLWYGAIDLRVAPDGDLVFLEVNPAGQWLFVELATEQAISVSLARLLARLDRRRDAAVA